MFSWSTFLDARNYSSSLSHWEVCRNESYRNIQGRNPSHKARAPVTSQSEQELAELHRLQVKVIQDVGELWGPACPLVTGQQLLPRKLYLQDAINNSSISSSAHITDLSTSFHIFNSFSLWLTQLTVIIPIRLNFYFRLHPWSLEQIILGCSGLNAHLCLNLLWA